MEPSPMALDKSTIDRSNSNSFLWLRPVMGSLGAAAPELAARIALPLFLRTRRHPRPVREERWLAAAERFPVPLGRRSIAAWSWGSGPPVLLVHGWEGRGSQMGALALALAAAGMRAVAFDAPGHGDSPGRSSSLLALAQALLAVAERVGPLAGVVAHSAGASATAYGLGREVLAPRVVFFAPGVDPVGYVRLFGRLLGLGPAVQRRMERRLEARFGISLEDFRILRRAPAMEMPLLLVWDEDDAEVPRRDVEHLAVIWPAAHLEVTRGLGHRRVLREPALVARAVSFLAGRPVAAPEPVKVLAP
jgi:pimeloyl-ACP methyl ester carboxylesterase